jgi:sugar lactone lactonase YvrE
VNGAGTVGGADVANVSVVCAIPTARFAYVPNFGDNTVSIYAVNAATGQLRHRGYVAAGTGPNAVAIDRRGNLYVSDSFAGTVTRLRADGSGVATWASDPLLTTAGQPPFGANGLAFDAGERFLYVANTGNSNVLRIPLRADGSAGPVEVWAHGADLDQRTGGSQSLHGADGIQFDVEGNLWVCANQANEIQVLSPAGELVARYRGAGGAALDFPASLIFRGRTLYLTNLSLATGAVNSKLSVMRAPVAGAPLVR